MVRNSMRINTTTLPAKAVTHLTALFLSCLWPTTPAYSQQTTTSEAEAAAQQSISNITGNSSPSTSITDITSPENNQINQQINLDNGSNPRTGPIACPSPSMAITTGSSLTPNNGGLSNSNFVGLAFNIPLGNKRTCQAAAESYTEQLRQVAIKEAINNKQKAWQSLAEQAKVNQDLALKQVELMQKCSDLSKSSGIPIQSIPTCAQAFNGPPQLPAVEKVGKEFTPSGRGLDKTYSSFGDAASPNDALSQEESLTESSQVETNKAEQKQGQDNNEFQQSETPQNSGESNPGEGQSNDSGSGQQPNGSEGNQPSSTGADSDSGNDSGVADPGDAGSTGARPPASTTAPSIGGVNESVPDGFRIKLNSDPEDNPPRLIFE